MERWYKFIYTFFYTGLLPKAPGTWASLLFILLFGIIYIKFNFYAFSFFFLIGLIIMSILLYSRCFEGDEDPPEFVIDEIIGLYLGIGICGPKNFLSFFVLFIFFRIFDILKPFPIKYLERLPGAYGVLLDDIAAGLIAGALVLWIKVGLL